MKLLNKFLSPIKNFFLFFSSKESINENKSLETQKKSKKISKELFQSLKYPRFHKTPVLVLFLILVISINLILFLLPFVLDSKILSESELPLHAILFSNHPDSVTVNHQY
ncbi:MAG: hypothetical protein QJQ54_02285 [Mollicutes bacterium]|nr:MAG: hypothetical protein QJQ54_02285 [Mollicutes bacterium]